MEAFDARPAHRFQKGLGAHDVRTCERGRIEEGPAVVGLRGEIHDDVRLASGEDEQHERRIGNVASHEHIPIGVLLLHVLEHGDVPRVCE